MEAYELVEQCEKLEKNFPLNRCMWLLSCYNIEMYVSQQLPQKAEAYIIEADKYNNIDDFYVFCYYNLVSASYYHRALEKVDMVLSQTENDYLPALKMKAELLMKAGKEQEAAQLYHKSVNLIDSTYNESLSKQINQLRTIHEVDKLELRNKQIEVETGRYKLTITLALIVLLIVVLVIGSIHYFRIKHIKNLLEKSDKELKKDKEQLPDVPETMEDYMLQQLKKTVILKDGNTLKDPHDGHELTAEEAIAHNMINAAMKGDVKAATYIQNLQARAKIMKKK